MQFAPSPEVWSLRKSIFVLRFWRGSQKYGNKKKLDLGLKGGAALQGREPQHREGSPSFPSLGLAREGPSPLEGEVKAKWHLEVQLDGGTLVVSPQSVLDLNVHLRRRRGRGTTEQHTDFTLLAEAPPVGL